MNSTVAVGRVVGHVDAAAETLTASVSKSAYAPCRWRRTR